MRFMAIIRVETMYDEHLAQPFSRWYHPKSKGYYMIIAVSTNSTNREPPRRVVVYWSELKREYHHREIAEFLDGRFVPLDGYGKRLRIGPDDDRPEVP